MFGIQDLSILLVLLLCLLSAGFCVVYGVINWNKGQDQEGNEIDEELKWEEEDIKINESL